MMKKLLVLALPVLVLTGCTNEDDIQVVTKANKEVSFRAVNYTLSRTANALDLTNPLVFNTENTMNVTALYTPASSTTTASQAIFEDVEFSYNTTDEVWKSATPYFYPYDGTLQFMAYSTKVPVENTTGRKAAAWTYATGNTAFSTLTLDFQSALAGEEDVLYVKNVKTQDCSGTIPANQALAFSHALALVTFKIQGTDASSAATIKVNSITLKDAYLSGEVVITTATDGTNTAVWTPANRKNQKDFAVPGASQQQLTTTAEPFGTGILLVDQDPGQFTVNYDMTVGTKTYEGLTKTVSFTTTATTEITNPITKWVNGNKYIYTIILSPKEITFTGTVNAWEDGGSQEEKITD